MGRQDESGNTLVYVDGGRYIGSFRDIESIDYWKEIGREHGQKWMYKGYAWYSPNPIPDNYNDTVIVFDTKKWSSSKIAERKRNGFLSIREHVI